MCTNDQISVYLFSRNEPVCSLPQQSARTSPIPGNVMFRAFCVASLCVDDPERWWAICGPSVGHRVQIWETSGFSGSWWTHFGLAKFEFVGAKLLKSGQLKCTLSGIFNRPEPLCTLPKGKLRVAEKRKNYKVRY